VKYFPSYILFSSFFLRSLCTC